MKLANGYKFLVFLIVGFLTIALLFVFLACEKNPTENKSKVPEVVTFEVTEITGTSATCGGNVTSDGGTLVTARGVCWSMDQDPKISDNKTDDGIGAGSYTSKITGLTGITTYYVRAYATNSVGTGYGSIMAFTTMPTVTDIDGNVYQIVKIGDQWWLGENLKVIHYRNGDAIHEVTDDDDWYNLKTGAYCEYEKTYAHNLPVYGYLYNWYAVTDGRKIAPDGWHVPTDGEWMILEIYLGMAQSEVNLYGWRGTNEGGKLKETGIDHWIRPNTGATNETGFSALPGGYRQSDGTFYNQRYFAYYWTATEISSGFAWSRMLSHRNSDIGRYDSSKRSGFSVRLVKD